MRLTADFCRAQAEAQRMKAADEPLENRRAIALFAAKSWDEAAIAAVKSASSDGSPLERLDAEITLEFAQETEARSRN
jgi:hypothetical protein